MNKKICVLGGDLRQKTVCDLLIEDGYNVKGIALSDQDCRLDCLSDCDILVLPVPASYDITYVNAPLCKEKIKISDVVRALPQDCLVMGGVLTYEVKAVFEEYGIKYFDYFTREELIIKNAIPTAEGAIEIALSELPITLFGSHALVVGYGRIGKILSERLKALGSYVTVSARKYKDFAWIEEKGMGFVHTDNMWEGVDKFDVIFNTVPAVVLTRREIERIRSDSLIIDLASKPGGVDFTAAKELRKNVIWALSIPGKTAPITSGKIIKDTILNIIAELEV